MQFETKRLGLMDTWACERMGETMEVAEAAGTPIDARTAALLVIARVLIDIERHLAVLAEPDPDSDDA
jgi:hypothetical protein